MSDKSSAIVLSASRRVAKVMLPDHSIHSAKISNKFRNVCVGEYVEVIKSDTDYLISNTLERKNQFRRTLGHKYKDIAVNIDFLFLVVAVGSLFQTQFIDRVLAVASYNDIPVCVIVNKIDLDLDSCKTEIEYYKSIGIKIILLSAKFNNNLNNLSTFLLKPENKVVSFTGVSGVGKSTLLNHYIPKANRITNEVREKSKMGQQTTTHAEGYLFKRENTAPLIMIDPPGVQKFGITELSEEDLKYTYKEFRDFEENCKYRDCLHINEDECGVKDALNKKEIAEFRYNSYISLIEEITHFKSKIYS